MTSSIVLENVQLIFRNFEGRPDKYDAYGKRQFNVLLDEALANELTEQGYNVKPLKKLDEDDEQKYHMNVRVNFDSRRPPRVTMLGFVDGEEVSRVDLDASTVGILDGSNVISADIEINPYEWEPGKLKGYLDRAFVAVEMSYLDAKYADDETNPLKKD